MGEGEPKTFPASEEGTLELIEVAEPSSNRD